ncbi:MAG: ABC transporter permease [Eubacteriaceae bacterium]|nr:ABC transporter permease [Eubacteriaceae bacterium]
MKIRTFGVFIRDAINSIKRNSVMSLASVLSVICALIIVGVVMAIAINVNFITDQIEENLELKVFLENDVSEAQKQSIYKAINEMESVIEVTYQSKQEALDAFRKTLGDENSVLISGYTAENSPLPASYIVKFEHADDIAPAGDYLNLLEGVREAVYGEDTVNALLSFNKLINAATWIVLAILSVIAVFIIFNTVKLTVFSRRNEIGIMKYIGATNAYIRFPFIIEGMLLGIFGAGFSVLMLRNLYYFVVGMLRGTTSVLPLGESLAPAGLVIGQISMVFIAYGILLGAIGSSFSIKKFLKV